ncbi:MAG: succinate dehydrogenase assembly factor 2 [Gammaproteobacteria bacterium]
MEQSQLSRLRWRCRRGIKEMDLLLLRFLEQVLPGLDERQQEVFSQLLEEADLDIYAWITGRATPQQTAYLDIVSHLQTLAEKP